MVALKTTEEARFILCGHAFGDDDDKLDAGFRRFHDGALNARCWNENARRGGAGGGTCVTDGREYWDAFNVLTSTFRIRAGDHECAVRPIAQAVETASASSQPLIDDTRRFVDEDAHGWSPWSTAI